MRPVNGSVLPSFGQDSRMTIAAEVDLLERLRYRADFDEFLENAESLAAGSRFCEAE